MLEASVSVAMVQQILGHSSIETTLRYLTSATNSRGRDDHADAGDRRAADRAGAWTLPTDPRTHTSSHQSSRP
jgi:integrase